MQCELFKLVPDLSNKRVLIGLSGGINSAALLCYLASEYPFEYRPKKIWLYAVHLKEHSPDSFQFVKALIRYAACHFEIRWSIYWDSVNRYFEREGMIPHPLLSPCSDNLKIRPMRRYMQLCSLDFDLVGYVRSEQKRIKRQRARGDGSKLYLIGHLTNDDCFDLVKREIGWFPAIYDIKEGGRMVFHHNNCLPCKNMAGLLSSDSVTGDFAKVQLYYPEYFGKARAVADRVGAFWGRLPKDNDFDGECDYCKF